ncbi:hypothetical protein SDC9_127995 [bioreactor metagenome]|uniref:Uncharacterized protein n=1 Tax=bioreactor metagenome TaxID=1076179 RepID=A0A645CVK4_9ZZZZ
MRTSVLSYFARHHPHTYQPLLDGRKNACHRSFQLTLIPLECHVRGAAGGLPSHRATKGGPGAVHRYVARPFFGTKPIVIVGDRQQIRTGGPVVGIQFRNKPVLHEILAQKLNRIQAIEPKAGNRLGFFTRELNRALGGTGEIDSNPTCRAHLGCIQCRPPEVPPALVFHQLTGIAVAIHRTRRQMKSGLARRRVVVHSHHQRAIAHFDAHATPRLSIDLICHHPVARADREGGCRQCSRAHPGQTHQTRLDYEFHAHALISNWLICAEFTNQDTLRDTG